MATKSPSTKGKALGVLERRKSAKNTCKRGVEKSGALDFLDSHCMQRANQGENFERGA